MKRIFGIWMAVVLLFPRAVAGAENQDDQEYFYYGYRGRTVRLTMSTERIGVRFEDGLTAEEQAGALAAYGDLLPLDGSQQPEVVTRRGMAVV